MGVSPVDIGPFTEGVNLVDPPSMLTPNELVKCLNWRTGVRGDFYKRPGHGNYGSAPAQINGAAFVNLLLRYYRTDGTRILVGAAGGKLRQGNDSTGAWTDISINGSGASMSASNLADWMVYKNRLYITDGVTPQRWNTVDNIYAGGFTPVAPTLAQAGGGVPGLTLLGVYQYFVTSVAGDMGEGPQGATATITLTTTNNKVTLNPVADAAAKYEETAKNIYRTKAGGSVFFLLTQLAHGITSYVDQIADTNLGLQYVPTQVPPATARFIIVGHDERTYYFGMSGTDASLVRVSDVGFPDRLISTDFFTVANNDGDILTGGGLVSSGVVFLKKNSCWLSRAFGTGLINIRPREKRGSGVGTTSPFSVVSTPIGLIFLSQQGRVNLFDEANLTEIGRKVSSEFIGMTQTSMANVVACYHDYRYIISYDYRGSKGYNWRTLEYDTRTNKWEGPHENRDFYNPSYYSVWDSVLDKTELYWGEAKAATGSFVYGRTEYTKTDRGTKFLSQAISGAIPLAGLAEVKSTKVFIHGEFSSDATLTFSHISPEDNVKTSVDLNSPILSTGGIWGSAIWGVSKWGGSNIEILEGPLEPCRSRTPQFEISDGGTATTAKMNIVKLLAEGLSLK